MSLPKFALQVIRLRGMLEPITVSTVMVSLAIGLPDGKESIPALYKLQIRFIETFRAGVVDNANAKNRNPLTVRSCGAPKNCPKPAPFLTETVLYAVDPYEGNVLVSPVHDVGLVLLRFFTMLFGYTLGKSLTTFIPGVCIWAKVF